MPARPNNGWKTKQMEKSTPLLRSVREEKSQDQLLPLKLGEYGESPLTRVEMMG